MEKFFSHQRLVIGAGLFAALLTGCQSSSPDSQFPRSPGDDTAELLAPTQTLVARQSEDTSITLRATGPGAPTFNVLTGAQSGWVYGTAPSLVYRPQPGFLGRDNFSYVVRRGSGRSTVGSIALEVIPKDGSPYAVPQELATNSGSSIAIRLEALPSKGPHLTFSIVTPPSHGALGGTGTLVTYSPETGFSGEDTFSFEARDERGLASAAKVVIRVLDAPLRIQTRTEVAEANADHPFTAEYSTAIGWGFMAPAVVEYGGHTYTLSFAPSDPKDRKLYCARVWKDGAPWSAPFCADAFAREDGQQPKFSYQPPILFRQGNELFIAHGVIVGPDPMIRTYLALGSTRLEDSAPTWRKRPGHLTPVGRGWNYLGAATMDNGTLVVAGWEWGTGTPNSLSIVSLAPPYESWKTYDAVATSPSEKSRPLYTHVTVGKDGTVRLLTSFGHNERCMISGTNPTSYKTVALYEGTLGGRFTLKWSEGTPDLNGDMFALGDPCRYTNMRFAQDLVQDSDNGDPIALILREAVGPSRAEFPFEGNRSATRTFAVLRAGTEVVRDLAPKFQPVIRESKGIDSIKMTQLKNGEYAFVAASHREGVVAAISTTDLVNFSAPTRLDAPYGVGNSVKLSQPRKNGSIPSDHLVVWFSGNASPGNTLNRFLRYLLFDLTLAP